MKKIENFFENTGLGQVIFAAGLCMAGYVLVFMASIFGA